MLVQVYYPQSLSHTSLDEYLADGWFRSCNMLFRSKLICLDDEVFSLVYLRLNLTDYHRSKSLRKLFSKNNRLFRHQIRKASVNEAKQRLYNAHKQRFQGFVFNSLEHYFLGDSVNSVFDTYEICVYEGDKLVAVSFFDMGDDSIASLLGLYEKDYGRYSLGLYTMLLEIEFARRFGKSYYYPGYILDHSSQFDYKLRLGDMEYYTWKNDWLPFKNFSRTDTVAALIRGKIGELLEYLTANNIHCERVVYPFFGMGYSIFFLGTLVRNPVFINCYPDRQHPEGTFYIVEYILDEKVYALSSVRTYAEYSDMFEMDRYGDYVQTGNQMSELLCYEEMIMKDAKPEYILNKLRQL